MNILLSSQSLLISMFIIQKEKEVFHLQCHKQKKKEATIKCKHSSVSLKMG